MQLVKLAVSVFAFVAVAALAAGSAVAGPIFGEYTSTDMGGTVNTGRWSEGDTAGPYAPGNWGHAQDWDGTTLGGMWEFSGAVVSDVAVIYPTDPLMFDDGIVVIFRPFNVTNATFSLKDAGPWCAPGDSDYTFTVTEYLQILTMTLVDSAVVFARSTDVFEAYYNMDPSVTLHGQIVGVYQGEGELPANYPTYDPAGTTGGRYGVAEGLHFTIVPEPATMGLLAMGLGGLLLRRRKGR